MLALKVLTGSDSTSLVYVNTALICDYTPGNEWDHITLANKREYFIADEDARKKLRQWVESGDL